MFFDIDKKDDSIEQESKLVHERISEFNIAPSGPSVINLHKYLAVQCFEQGKNYDAIFHLTEAHGISFKTSLILRHKKALRSYRNKNEVPKYDGLDMKHVDTINVNNKVEDMLKKISEFPKEWTIIQLSMAFNPSNLFCNYNTFKGDIHISRLNCGTTNLPCYSMKTNDYDFIVEPLKELEDILSSSTSVLKNRSQTSKDHFKSRIELNYRMRNLVRSVELKWIGYCKFLMLGKLRDIDLNNNLQESLFNLLQLANSDQSLEISENAKTLLLLLLEASRELSQLEIHQAVAKILNINSKSGSCKFISKGIFDIGSKFSELKSALRHPIILIVDEALESFPWERMELLNIHPVTRISSLSVLYALFCEHKSKIIDGMYHVSSPERGYFVVNPDGNLEEMEERLRDFLSWRAPTWKGTYGNNVPLEAFAKGLEENSLFIYSGHGSGTHIVNLDKIAMTNCNAVVLLFGCSSLKLQSLGGRVEFLGPSQSYLSASCPCIVGMLWNVTDLDVDRMCLEMMNVLLPDFNSEEINSSALEKNKIELLHPRDKTWKRENELLMAMNKGRQMAKHYLTSAAFISRGLPIYVK